MGLLKKNLEPTDFEDSVLKVCDWVDYGHYGQKQYRVWICKCGNHWFQRHEWLPEGENQSKLDDWLYSGYWPRRKFETHMKDPL